MSDQGAPQSFSSASLVYATNTGALSPSAANPLIFGTETTRGNAITYNVATGIFQLRAGNTYMCQAGTNTGTFSGVTGLSIFRWRDLTGAALFGVQGQQSAATTATDIGQSGPGTGIISVTADTTIQYEAITLTAFTSVANSWAIVQVVA